MRIVLASLCGALLLAVTTGCTNSDSATALAAAPAADANRQAAGAKATSQQEPGAIGSKAPAWENLEGTDGKKHSLGDLKDAKAVVVVFTCNTCPVARAYEERLKELADEYRDKGVEVVAINVNKIEGDRLADMQQRAEEQGFNFAYIYDPSQQIARDYGATVTPHVFLLDPERRIVYAGAIDDSQNPEKISRQHLREAIDAVLAGQKPPTETTKQFGCTIKYE